MQEASISFQYDTKPEKRIITIRINDQTKRYIFKRIEEGDKK